MRAARQQRQQPQLSQPAASIHTHILAREESLIGVLELSSLPKAAADDSQAPTAPTPPGTAPLLLRHLGDRHTLLVLQAGV